MENKVEYKSTAHEDSHFFASSIATWYVSENIDEVIEYMKSEENNFHVYFVPVSIKENYDISFYAPKVPGTINLAYWEVQRPE